MTAADTQPTLPFPPAPAEPARRRGGWRWLVALIVLAVLLVGAAVAAEFIARSTVERTIRDLVVTQVGLPADQAVGVELPGLVLPQLIRGTLDEVTVTSDDVSFDRLTGDVAVHASGIPIRGDAPAAGGTAEVRLDQAQLQALLATVEGVPDAEVSLAAPDVTATTELNLFGARVPVGIALTPGAADGDVTLTPVSATIAGAQVDAEGLRDRFGGLADTVLRTYDICIAQYLPAALTLTSVQVVGAEVVAGFDVDGAVVTDAALQENGTCS